MTSGHCCLITLLTDFGTVDWFAGTMKGVIAALAKDTRVIDLTHEVPPGDIRAGAFSLKAAYRFFPKGTVHVAVVDPGVGSNRRAIAVQTADYFFVGPDNGLLSWALRNEKVKSIRSVENADYFLRPISSTFHGRDIFAPVAAHLSSGVPLAKIGPAQDDLVRLPWPSPKATRRGIQGQILYFDRFGNAITNLDGASLRARGHSRIKIRVRGKLVCCLATHYHAVPPGKPVAMIGSTDLLEIAINEGRAVEQLKLRLSDLVTAELDI